MGVRAAVAVLPLKLTCDADADDWQPGDHQGGLCLNARMTRYLEAAERGLSAEERLLHLEDLDRRAYRAHLLRRAGHPVARIAGQMRCSEATVYRLLAVARRVTGQDAELGDAHMLSYEERLERLRAKRPEAYAVYTRMGYRWPQEVIAQRMGVSVRTVKRLSAEAREYMGGFNAEGLRRHRPPRALAVAAPRVALAQAPGNYSGSVDPHAPTPGVGA